MVAANDVTRCACWAASWTALAAVSEPPGPAEPDADPPDGVDDAAWFEVVQPAAASAAAVTAIAAQRVRLEREVIATSAADSRLGIQLP
jgi:hypothetical protein